MRALIKKTLCLLASFNLGVTISVSANTLAIPDVPLQTGSDVPPNIMFILDNSLSMSLEHMPDEISWGWRVSTSGRGDSAINRWYYSSRVNTIYYDPTKTYSIPVGASYEPSYTSARLDGLTSNTTTTNNLSNRFVLEYDEWNSTYSGYVAQGSLNFTTGGFYFQYDETLSGCNSNERNNSCYRYVSVNSASEAQKQNFAIWYSYYRSRLLLSRSAIMDAFSTLPENVRVGYTAINNASVVSDVREFSGVGRTNFMNWLRNYGTGSLSSWTPLRGALRTVGNYYSDDKPYRVDPSRNTSASNPIVSCRQNFAILMTDGAWNQDATLNIGGDIDGDQKSNTLADVARYYYINDLRPAITNNVPKRKSTSPNWQHMVTFGVGLGVDGTLDPKVARNYLPNDTRWPSPFSAPNNNTLLKHKTDDLLHASVNSDGGFFSAKDPATFSAELKEALKGIIERVASASNIAATSTSLREENSVFQASFDTTNWSGNLVSRDTKDLSIQWSANFAPWADRPIFTSRTEGGTTTKFAFTWANLNSSEKTALESANIVNYLKGDRANEKPTGTLRQRVSLLGDIAHSSPVYVGAPQNRNYQRYGWDGASTYTAFLAAKKNRAPMVYVGANDGMLHGFDANPSSSTKGRELFAYVPQRMLTASAQLASFAKETYAHRFYVDGSPTVGDVFINGAWRSVLVTTLGRGGNSIFALDVTDPANISLLWDLSIPELGIMTAKPVITRLNNGRWAAVMPYGYNNSTSKNGLLIVDIANGTTTAKLEVPAAGGALGQPEGWDMDRNGNTDWFFAGDLKGNVWKFDLANALPGSWRVAYSNTPLFTAKDTTNKAQPITGGITLSSHPQTGQLWLFFGTGKYLETGDSLNNDPQSWYGIVDGTTAISGRAELVRRTITNTTYTNGGVSEQTRTVSAATTNDMVNKRGWFMDLIDTRERVTSKARIVGSNLIMNTIIPDSDLCNPQGDGWVMAIDPFSGSRLKYHLFDLSGDGEFTNSDGINSGTTANPVIDVASGLRFEGMPGEPVFVGELMLVGDSRVAIDSRTVNLQLRRGRISWREEIN